MMDKQHGKYIFMCDICHAVLDAHTSDWETAQAVRSENDWLAIKNKENGEWEHACPNCA